MRCLIKKPQIKWKKKKTIFAEYFWKPKQLWKQNAYASAHIKDLFYVLSVG